MAGYKTELISIEVGSRGVVCSADFRILKVAVSETEKDLCLEVIRTTLQESLRIWVFIGTPPSEFSCIYPCNCF